MFDEENIVLSFGVLSDVHICEAASETSSPKGSPGSAWIVGLVIALVLIAAAACGVWFFRKK